LFTLIIAHITRLVKYLSAHINTIAESGAKMGDIFKIIGDLGMPVAAALDNRVKTMNHDVIRIDTIVSNALGLRPDADRIARADGKNDARRD
jgi:hypothetical protein